MEILVLSLSTVTDSRLNESFEALTSQNLTENTNENKKNIEEITISKNMISLETPPKDKENYIEKLKFSEEKIRGLQNDNNNLQKEVNKQVFF